MRDSMLAYESFLIGSGHTAGIGPGPGHATVATSRAFASGIALHSSGAGNTVTNNNNIHT